EDLTMEIGSGVEGERDNIASFLTALNQRLDKCPRCPLSRSDSRSRKHTWLVAQIPFGTHGASVSIVLVKISQSTSLNLLAISTGRFGWVLYAWNERTWADDGGNFSRIRQGLCLT